MPQSRSDTWMEPTHTAAGNGRGTSPGAERPWSRLPDDLLGMVFARLDSVLDHVRFAAVCASWRAAVSTRPPSRVHPWLVLEPHDDDDGGETKRAYCPGDGTIMPLATHLSETGSGKRFVGCHPGGWVAYEAPPLGVMNVFSGAEVVLPPAVYRSKRRSIVIVTRKVIFSAPPTSSGCIVAAITDRNDIVICMLGSLEGGWTTRRFYGQPVVDIAFCNGYLYCLVKNGKKLARFEVGLDESGVPVFGAVHWHPIENQEEMQSFYFGNDGDADARAIYILELCGKLLMAVRGRWGPRGRLRRNREPYFMVFKLADVEMDPATNRHLYWWIRVESLNDYALFLGPTSSKAMRISTTTTSGRGGTQRNHIYYSHHRCLKNKKRMPDYVNEFLTTTSSSGGCRVYYKKDQGIDNSTDWIATVGHYVCGDGHPPIWLFPPDI